MKLKIKKVIPIMALIITAIFTANVANAISSDFCSLVDSLYQYAIGAVGILSALGIAIAGVIWITAAGNSSKIGEAQSWIISSLLGLALALGAYFILNIINPDLALCGNYSVSSIASVGNVSAPPGKAYPKQAGYKGTLCNDPGDGSGVYWCCVINGELDGSGFNILFGVDIKRCCSYEFKDRASAEAECLRFYNTHTEETIIGEPPSNPLYMLVAKEWTFWKKDLYLGKPATIGGGGSNSATVTAARCENNASVKKWCIAKTDPDFCAEPNTPDGEGCLIAGNPDDTFGYCENKKCNPCKTWGDACTHDYQCPNQAYKASARCGRDVVNTLSVFSADCDWNDVCDYAGK